jgi:uncharacterized protein (TIRG00374 family)
VKGWIGQCVKVAVPIGILAWLFYRLLNDNPQDLRELLERPKNWPRFATAISVYLTAVTLTFYRWYLLVRSLRLPFRISDALRLGFIGFLLQFVSLGAVGGDLFKALFVVREQPTRKPEAVATIFIDRIVGMLSLLILASLVILFTPALDALPQYAVAGQVFLVAAAVGILIFVLLLFTSLSVMPLTAPVRKFQFVRQTMLRVEGAIKLYRADRMSVVLAVGLSIITHLMQAAAIYLAATAFFPQGPGLADQIIMWAVAGSVGALPIAPGGLGTFELTYQWLYELLSPTLIVANEGFLVALLYRVMSVLSAGIGVFVYFSCRREMQSVFTETTASV